MFVTIIDFRIFKAIEVDFEDIFMSEFTEPPSIVLRITIVAIFFLSNFFFQFIIIFIFTSYKLPVFRAMSLTAGVGLMREKSALGGVISTFSSSHFDTVQSPLFLIRFTFFS